MHDPTLDPVATLLRGDGRLAMTVAEIARQLPAAHRRPGTAFLERRLREDPRFIVLDTDRPFPWTEGWGDRARARYAPALRDVEVAGSPLVLLNRATAAATVSGLLRHTLLDLVRGPDRPAVVATTAAVDAERARAALALSRRRGAGGPSTSRPPGPRPRR